MRLIFQRCEIEAGFGSIHSAERAMNPPRTFVMQSFLTAALGQAPAAGRRQGQGASSSRFRLNVPCLCEVWKALLYHSLAGAFGERQPA